MNAATPSPSQVVIRASAGTGKTFRLANRFIGLLADGRSSDRVLAATFARKAAGEILDRILVRIAQAVLDETCCKELAKQIGRPGLDQSVCKRLLQDCLARLHCLRIGTLDSFFIQIASHYGPELGLPLGWSIVDDLADASLRNAAIQSVIGGQETAAAVTLMNLLSKGDATRSVSEEMHQIVRSLYSLSLEASPDAWDSVPRRKRLEDQEIASATEALAALTFTDKRFAKAQAKDLEHARQRDWDTFIDGGLAAKIAGGATSYYNKDFEDDVLRAYRPLLVEAQAVLVNRLADQNAATRSLLEKFDREFRRLKLSRGVLRFEDVTRDLAAALSDGRLSNVTYRLDAHVEHLMLDEFQDTSMQQWTVIRPFAERATALNAEGSFFCVGDVKQAIYGWRGGVSEIFDAIREQLPEVAEEFLVESYRSSPVIVAAVNGVFDHLENNQALLEFASVARRWKTRFQTHTTARSEYPGYVRLVAGPFAEEGEKQAHATVRFAASEIARLAAEHPGRAIGVLVRKNATVARIMYELRAVHQLAASEEGGNPLTDSPAVQVVLSLLKLIDHPKDGIARFHVAHTPLGPAVGIQDFADERQAVLVSGRLRETLLTQGYGRTIYEWLTCLAAWCDARELGRLQQLVELAYAYDSDGSLRTDDFADLVALRRIEAPNAAAIRVMTVHQSKGLQFDIVVLPELDSRLQGITPDVVVDRRRNIDPIERICRYVDQNLQVLLPENLQKVFQRWPEQVVDEALCVLYVALTRAVHALHLITAPTKPNKNGQVELKFPCTYSGVLRAALIPQIAAVPGVLYETGDSQWQLHAKPGAEPLGGSGEPEGLSVTLRPSTERTRGWERKSPSGLEGGDRVNLADRLRPHSLPAMERGTLVHAWFELIDWLDDDEPSDELLDLTARRFGKLSVDVNAVRVQFRAYLQKPTVVQSLSRRSYENPTQVGWSEAVVRELMSQPFTLEVQRERPFIVRDGGALLEGAIDRLVVLRQGGRAVAADILDFKTDNLPNAEAANRANEFYRPQLEAYRRAVMQLTGLSAERVAARLLFVACDALQLV